MEKLIFKTEGMACAGCSARIQNALGKLDGVSSVTADFKTGDVVIEGESLDRAALAGAIEDLGFDVLG